MSHQFLGLQTLWVSHLFLFQGHRWTRPWRPRAVWLERNGRGQGEKSKCHHLFTTVKPAEVGTTVKPLLKTFTVTSIHLRISGSLLWQKQVLPIVGVLTHCPAGSYQKNEGPLQTVILTVPFKPCHEMRISGEPINLLTLMSCGRPSLVNIRTHLYIHMYVYKYIYIYTRVLNVCINMYVYRYVLCVSLNWLCHTSWDQTQSAANSPASTAGASAGACPECINFKDFNSW